jgi:CPA2 family monovalent cation:H+ antiporter-2
VELTLLSSIVVIFGLSIAVVFLFNLLRIPAVVGFILTGLLVGPHGLSLISALDQVEMLAEIGIILLLFTIGLEFSFRNLWKIRQNMLAGGFLQVSITAFIATAACLLLGLPTGESVLIGFLVALSSTAIVLKLLQERGEVDTPHGSMTLAILIFQDLAAIPMMLALPFLAGIGALEGGSLVTILFWDIAIIVFLIICAKWFVPFLLFQIARTRNRELFLLFVVLTCIGVAWLTSLAGLSLALGALLAGLIISESEYSSQAIGNIIPFRDVFTSFFFVSVGMLLDIQFLAANWLLIIFLVLLVIVLKGVIAGGVPAIFGYPIRTIILVGLSLGQVGEFSFILSQSGLQFGLLSPEAYQVFIAVALLTMAATPFLLSAGPYVVNSASRLPLPNRFRTGQMPGLVPPPPPLHDHLVVVGYGVNGRNLSRAARVGGIPYVILEMNPETVRAERAKGEPIAYGDATNEAVLHHASIEEARILVVVINDPTSSRRIAELARRMNPNLYIIVRTRYIQEVGPLYKLGTDEVIPEEFETSVEIFTRVLKKYLIPRATIDRFIAEVRADNYQILRSLSRTSASLTDLTLNIPDIEISTFRVVSGAAVCGKSLGEMALRKRFAVTVVAIERKGQIIPNPGAESTLEELDRAIIIGTPEKIAEAAPLFLNSNEQHPDT